MLMHCFAGCGTDEVLAALGLTFSDLFPSRLPGAHAFPAVHLSIPAGELLTVHDHELVVAVLVLNDIRRAGGSATDEQLARLTRAAARIGRARDIANPAKVKAHAQVRRA
jgi:hypothetical protein